MDSLDQIAISFGGGVSYEVIPEDVYEVVIASITPKEAKKYMSEEMETVLLVEFVIVGGEHEGAKIFKRVRPKLGINPKPSNLYQVWAATLGKNPGEDSFPDFHLSNLIGKQLRVTVTNTQKGDLTYNNVNTMMVSKAAKAVQAEKEDIDVDAAIASMEKK